MTVATPTPPRGVVSSDTYSQRCIRGSKRSTELRGELSSKPPLGKKRKLLKKSTTSVCLGIFSDGFVKKLKGQQETGMYEITSHEIIKTYVIWQATHSGIKTTYCFEQDYAVTNGAGTT